jgi:hypothetical protein
MKTLLTTTALSAMTMLVAAYPGSARSTEFVYVESNIQSPNGNSIFAFQQKADGSLGPLAGSPFLSGGAGVQYTGFVFGPYDSDQDLVWIQSGDCCSPGRKPTARHRSRYRYSALTGVHKIYLLVVVKASLLFGEMTGRPGDRESELPLAGC